jgi:hypothetical protein
MDHWLAVIGACLALGGTLALGIELLKTKVDEADEAERRADQDKIDSVVRKTVAGLGNALSSQAQFVTGYLKILEQDLEPLFKPLMADDGDKALRESLNLGITARHQAIAVSEQAQQAFVSSADGERAILLVQEVQRRTEARFKEHEATARRMRRIATAGVVLVGFGAAAQLLDVLLNS